MSARRPAGESGRSSIVSQARGSRLREVATTSSVGGPVLPISMRTSRVASSNQCRSSATSRAASSPVHARRYVEHRVAYLLLELAAFGGGGLVAGARVDPEHRRQQRDELGGVQSEAADVRREHA